MAKRKKKKIRRARKKIRRARKPLLSRLARVERALLKIIQRPGEKYSGNQGSLPFTDNPRFKKLDAERDKLLSES